MQVVELARLPNTFDESNCIHCFNHTLQLLAKMLLKPFNVTLANGASTCLSHAPQALQCCPCQQCLHMSVTFIPNPFFATPPHPFLMPHLFPSLLLPPPVSSSSPPALLDVQNFDVKTVLCASSTMLL